MSLHQGKLPSTRELSGTKVLLFLIAFRICNALLLRTFFQPDEYFQSLEPAWYTAFDGAESGAWITWVGPNHDFQLEMVKEMFSEIVFTRSGDRGFGPRYILFSLHAYIVPPTSFLISWV